MSGLDNALPTLVAGFREAASRHRRLLANRRRGTAEFAHVTSELDAILNKVRSISETVAGALAVELAALVELQHLRRSSSIIRDPEKRRQMFSDELAEAREIITQALADSDSRDASAPSPCTPP